MASIADLAPYRTPSAMIAEGAILSYGFFFLAFIVTLITLIALLVSWRRRLVRRGHLQRFESALERKNRPEILALLEEVSGLNLIEIKSRMNEDECAGFLGDMYQSDCEIDWVVQSPQLMRLYRRLVL